MQESEPKSRNCALEEIKKQLASQYECFVLITCSAPTAEGQMQVELSYEGDEVLAAYLVESAVGTFEGQDESRKI